MWNIFLNYVCEWICLMSGRWMRSSVCEIYYAGWWMIRWNNFGVMNGECKFWKCVELDILNGENIKKNFLKKKNDFLKFLCIDW